MLARPDSHRDLAAVAGRPALVLYGSEDALSPLPDQEAMLDVLPSATTLELAGVGHLSAVEVPDQVARIILDWLASFDS